jgi:hypothetical protein
MTIPGFAADASLGNTAESYVLTPGAPAETGQVLPQGYTIRQAGDGVDITYCEAGICINHHVKTVYPLV